DLARRLPHLKFAIAGGPYPEEGALFEQVKREVQALPNVRFLGQVPYHDIGEWFERARVLAGTSEVEGVPNTYLQAWGHGAPASAAPCSRRIRWLRRSARYWPSPLSGRRSARAAAGALGAGQMKTRACSFISMRCAVSITLQACRSGTPKRG